ncbi:MAG: hypothetical protein CMJ41_03285 [Phycisphaerae bacterium]|nr:hypothetical protein [Phycisphaerae bacterium]
MEHIGSFEAKTHLPRILDRIQQGESLIITRHGRPVAQLTPVAEKSNERARQAAKRILERRTHLKTAPVSELIQSIHEGHRY